MVDKNNFAKEIIVDAVKQDLNLTSEIIKAFEKSYSKFKRKDLINEIKSKLEEEKLLPESFKKSKSSKTFKIKDSNYAEISRLNPLPKMLILNQQQKVEESPEQKFQNIKQSVVEDLSKEALQAAKQSIIAKSGKIVNKKQYVEQLAKKRESECSKESSIDSSNDFALL